MPKSLPYLQGNLGLDNGDSLVQVLKRSGIQRKRIVHKEPGIISRTKCCWNSEKADILFSVQQPFFPGVRSKARDMGKLAKPVTADFSTIETFRIIMSVNQLSLYGAVAAVCEEFEGHQDRSGEPEVLMGH